MTRDFRIDTDAPAGDGVSPAGRASTFRSFGLDDRDARRPERPVPETAESD